MEIENLFEILSYSLKNTKLLEWNLLNTAKIR